MKIHLFLCCLCCFFCGCHSTSNNGTTSTIVEHNIKNDTIPSDFHKWQIIYLIEDSITGEDIRVDSIEYYRFHEEHGWHTGSYDNALYREEICTKRDYIICLMDSFVNIDFDADIIQLMYQLAYILQEIEYSFHTDTPATYCPMLCDDALYKLRRIEYFLSTSPSWPYEKEKMTRQILDYCFSSIRQ